MFSKNLPVSHYVLSESDNESIRVSEVRTPSIKARIAALLTMLIIVLSMFTSLSNSGTAFAEEKDPNQKVQEKLEEEANKYKEANNGEGESEEENFYNIVNKGMDDDAEANPFALVIQRVFSVDYLNKTPKAAPGGAYEPKEYNCDANIDKKNTAYYHNCDVPNILTEFMQDMFRIYLPEGIIEGERDNAAVSNQWFGMPSNIPDGEVPIDPAERSIKYTGLELSGYNFKYSTYEGEWDWIKVQTEARMMSNFGASQRLNLGAQSVLNGMVGGTKQSYDNTKEALGRGDLIGAVSGSFTGFFSGGASSSISTILDTSDGNVFGNNAWYRPDYGSTLYGARELNEDELAATINAYVYNNMQSADTPVSNLPDDFEDIKTPPPAPKEDIASCKIKNSSSENAEMIAYTGEGEDASKTAPGVSEDDCIQASKDQANGKDYAPEYEWSKDGTQKGETLAKWESNNKDWFEKASKYGLQCSIDTKNDSNKEDKLASFYACVPAAYDEALYQYTQQDREDFLENGEAEKIFEESGDGGFADFSAELGNESANQFRLMNERRKANFNAPWNRYVCLDENGKDMIDANGNFRYVFKEDGELTDNCGEIRAPIQDGFFGNGYIAGEQDLPGIDTRREAFDPSVFNVIFSPSITFNYVSNFFLSITSFTTRLSNTLLNLSFSPVLETIGVDKIVIDLIEGFRDSVFLPASVIVAGTAAVYILARSVKQRQYRGAFRDFLMIVVIFVLGVVMMFAPERTLRLVDNGPAEIEQIFIGSVFGSFQEFDDQLCTATDSVASGAESTDPESENDANSPKAVVRQLMCENWRVFAFNPWVAGQWGEDFNKLYASNQEDIDENNKLSNTNTDLVGDAEVVMGNDTSVHNWALYQLSLQSTGTGTTIDYSKPSGTLDPNMYRIVDMQMGPDNGEGTDSSYATMWSGNDPGIRLFVAGFSTMSSIFGFIAVASYSVTKILLSIMTTFILLALPFVFLVALFPGRGVQTLWKYLMTLIGLIVQRVVLVLALAVMMRVLISLSTATDFYIFSAMIAIAVCIIFISFRKWLMTNIMGAITQRTGQLASSDTSDVLKAAQDRTPSTIKNSISSARAKMTGAASGAAGNYSVNRDIGKAAKAAKENSKQHEKVEHNRQRRRGFGLGQSAGEAAKAARGEHVQSIKDELKHGAKNIQENKSSKPSGTKIPNSGGRSEDPNRNSNINVDSNKRLRKELNNVTGPEMEKANNLESSKIADGNPEQMSNRQLRGATKAINANKKIQKFDDKEQTSDRESRKIRESNDIESIAKQQDRNVKKNAKSETRRAKLADNYNKIMDQAVQDDVNRIQIDRKNQAFKNSLDELKRAFSSNPEVESTEVDTKNEKTILDPNTDSNQSNNSPDKNGN